MSKEQTSYHAFISYRHADNCKQGRQWATWLHQAIETYEVPKDLIGLVNSRGDEITQRIFPVFRDEKDLSADADLGKAITNALDVTRVLVVLCSPNATQSTYVAEEIDYFKKQGGSDRVLAVLIDGEPNTSWDTSKQQLGFATEDECFPIPLQFKYNPQGERTDERAEPIAADLRINNDGKKEQGWTSPQAYRKDLEEKNSFDRKTINQKVADFELQQHLTLLKIIAGILGVSFERLNRRDKAYQLVLEQRKAKRLRQWLSAVTLLAVLAIGAGFYAFDQQQIAEMQKQRAVEQRDKAEALLDNVRQNLDFMNFELRDVLNNYVPTAERVKVMKRIDALSETLSKHGGKTTEDQLALATALIQKAGLLLQSTEQDPEKALTLIQQGIEILKQIVKHDPDNNDYQSDLSVSLNRLGDVHLRLGNTDAALSAYLTCLKIRERLVMVEPDVTEFQSDLSVSHEKLGDIQLLLGNTDLALSAYEASLSIRQQLVKENPQNTEFKRDLAVSHGKRGDIQLRLGNINTAMSAYQAGLMIRKQLVKLYSDNIQFQRDLSVSHNVLGTILLSLGNAEAALSEYQASLTISEQLVAFDPDNTGLQLDLSIAYYNIIDNQLRLGNTNAALNAAQASLAITKHLVKHDSNNTKFLRSQSIGHSRLGDIQLRLGNIEAALSEFQASLATSEQLVKRAPDNTQFQSDLSIVHSKLGDIQRQLGKAKEALSAYQASLTIISQLVKRDPKNTQHQNSMSVIHNRIGNIFLRLDNTEAALNEYKTSMTINEQLVKLDPDNTRFQLGLSISHEKLGDIQQRTGDTEAALNQYQASLTINVELVKRDPNNTRLQRSVSVIHNRIGDMKMLQGDKEKALSSYQDSLKISEKLAKLDETNIQFQRDLFVSYWKTYGVYYSMQKYELALEMIKNVRHQLLFMSEKGSLANDDQRFIKIAQKSIDRLEAQLSLQKTGDS